MWIPQFMAISLGYRKEKQDKRLDFEDALCSDKAVYSIAIYSYSIERRMNNKVSKAIGSTIPKKGLAVPSEHWGSRVRSGGGGGEGGGERGAARIKSRDPHLAGGE